MDQRADWVILQISYVARASSDVEVFYVGRGCILMHCVYHLFDLRDPQNSQSDLSLLTNANSLVLLLMPAYVEPSGFQNRTALQLGIVTIKDKYCWYHRVLYRYHSTM